MSICSPAPITSPKGFSSLGGSTFPPSAAGWEAPDSRVAVATSVSWRARRRTAIVYLIWGSLGLLLGLAGLVLYLNVGLRTGWWLVPVFLVKSFSLLSDGVERLGTCRARNPDRRDETPSPPGP